MSESAFFAKSILCITAISKKVATLHRSWRRRSSYSSATIAGRTRKCRCSHPDVVGGVNLVGRGRSSSSNSVPSCYQLFPAYPKWLRFDLSYTLIEFPEAARPALRRVQRWEQVSRFNFTESPDPLGAQLKIGFYRGDGFRFGWAAVASWPTDSGQWMVGSISTPTNSGRSWTAQPGVDFESVAAHEMGHVLAITVSSRRW